MPRIYRYIYFFSYNKVFNSNLLFTVYFLKLCSFATPIPINCMSCRILSLLSPLDVFFSDNPHTDSVVCHLKPYLLIGQAWFPSLPALVVSLWLCWYLFPLSPCHPLLHQYENKHRKTQTLESRVWSFLCTALLDLLHYIKLLKNLLNPFKIRLLKHWFKKNFSKQRIITFRAERITASKQRLNNLMLVRLQDLLRLLRVQLKRKLKHFKP